MMVTVDFSATRRIGATALGGSAAAATNYSTALGFYARAEGEESTALGHQAQATNTGSFVWADSQNVDFYSQGDDTFNLRARGGVRLSSATSLFFGSAIRQMINLYSTNYAIGVQNFTHYSRTDDTGSFSWYRGGFHTNAANDPGPGGLRVNGTFVSASDRNLKENIQPVDPRAVLEKVAALPVSEWNYKTGPGVQHLGPMAQDFKAAFGLGDSDTGIASVDADGVAIAAIQGLNVKMESGKQEAATRMEKLEAENAELKQRLEKLERLLTGMSRGPAGEKE